VTADFGTSYLKNQAALVAALRDRDAELARDLMRNLMRRREALRPLVTIEA
jgi:DNA-binding GntR family transcriptional regulator